MLTRINLSNDNIIDDQQEDTIFDGDVAKKDILLVWIDQNVCLETADTLKTKQSFEEINNDVLYFTEVTDCVEYIKTIVMEKLFLVVSGSYSEEFLRLAHNYRQVDTIFIFCIEKPKYEELKDKYYKLVGIFNVLEDLIKCMTENIRLTGKQISVFELFDGKQRNIGFKWKIKDIGSMFGPYVEFDVYRKLILRMKFIDEDKKEMIDFCKSYYRENRHELKQIELFELTYDSTQAITWYTKQSFLYKLINKTMRIDSFSALHLFRYYITDLCINLKSNFDQFKIDNEFTPIITVYRGLKLSSFEVDLLKDNVGEIIHSSGFFSTTKNRSVAEMFAGVGTTREQRDDLESVIFEIEININQDETIFADVSSFSQFPQEEEVLFDLTAAFHLCELNFDSNTQLWICKLLPTGEIHGFKHELSNDSPTLDLLMILVSLESAQPKRHIFVDRLVTIPLRLKDNDGKCDIYMQIASAFHNCKNYQNAIKFYEQAHDICGADYVKSSKILILISYCYLDLDDFEHAIELLEKSLKILEDNVSPEPQIFLTVILLLGGVYSYVNNYSKALELYDRYIMLPDILSGEFFNNFLSKTDLLHRIGDVYWFREQYAMARHYYAISYSKACEKEIYNPEKRWHDDKAYEAVKKYLQWNYRIYFSSASWPPRGGIFAEKYYSKALAIAEREPWTNFDQSQLALNFIDFAAIYSEREKYDISITYLQRALSIYEETFPQKSKDIVQILLKLAKTYNSAMQFDKSIEYYLRYLDRTDDERLTVISDTGLAYENNNDLTNAIEYYKKAWAINDEENSSDTYIWLMRRLGTCYYKLGEDYKLVITYLKKALDKKEELQQPEEHDSLIHPSIDTWIVEMKNFIANIFYDNEQDDQALEYYLSVLKLREMSDEEYTTVEDANMFYRIGEIYYKKHMNKDALRYHQRSFNIKRKILQPGDSRINYSAQKIGLIHKRKGNNDQAIGYYRNVLKYREKYELHNDLDNAQTYHNIGNAYFDKSMFVKALENFSLALQLREKHCKNDDPDLAWTLHQIGMVYYNTRETDFALDYLERALQIRSEKWEENKNNIASSLEYIGRVYHFQKNILNEANTYYSRALEIYEEIQVSCISLLCNMGRLNASRSMYDIALEYYEKALSHNEKYNSNNNIDRADIYVGIGDLYFTQKINDSALQYYFLSLELFSPNDSPDYIEVAVNITRSIGIIFYRKKMNTEALDYFLKALNFYETGDKKDINQKATIYEWIGDVFYRNEDTYDQALEYYFKVLQIRDTGSQLIYHNIAFMYDKKNSFDEAVDYYLKYLNLIEEKIDKSLQDEKTLMWILFDIGEVYMKKFEYDLALNYFLNALKKQENLVVLNNSELIMVYEIIANIYLTKNDLKLSFEYYEKILEILLYSSTTKFRDLNDFYRKIMLVFKQPEQLKSAMDYFSAFTIDKLQNNNNDEYKANLDQNMSMIYYLYKETNQAIESFNKLLTNTTNDSEGIVLMNYFTGIMYKKTDLHSALNYFLEAVNICNIHNIPIIPEYYFELAQVYEHLEDDTNALKYYKKVTHVVNEVDNEELLVEYFNHIARFHNDRSEHDEALENYFKSIEQSPNSTIYVKIGQIFAQVKNDALTAMKYFRLALDVCDSTNIVIILYDILISIDCLNMKNECENKAFELCQTNNERVLISYQMGHRFNTNKKYEVSLHFFLKVLQFSNENLSVIDDTYYRIAHNYYNLNDKIRALEYFKKTLACPTINENTTLSCLTSVVHLTEFETDDEQAMSHSIELLTRSTDDIKLSASILLNIGWLYNKGVKFSAAHQYSNQAMDICLKHFPDDKNFIYHILLNIASIFDSESKYYSALETLLNMMNIIHDGLVFEDNQLIFAECLRDIGYIHIRLANTIIARDYCLLAKTIIPTDNSYTAVIIHTLADTYYYEKEFDQALKLYFQAMVLYSKESRRSIACLYSDIGRVYRQQKHYEEAIEYQTKAAYLYEELDPSQTICLTHSHSFYYLGNIYYAAGRLDESLVNHTKAFDIRKNLLPINHYLIGRSFHALANIISKTDSYGALEFYNQALNIYEETFYKHTSIHPVITEVKQDIMKISNDSRT